MRGVVQTRTVRASDISLLQEASFFSLVEMNFAPNACWQWQGHREGMGYGRFKLGNGRSQATRIMYALTHGICPAGMFVCHKCDNPECVRPDHLFLGTPAENALDRDSKRRQARGSRTGTAVLTEGQVREITKLILAGEMAYREIGRKFGVGKSTIQKIASGNNWVHMTGFGI